MDKPKTFFGMTLESAAGGPAEAALLTTLQGKPDHLSAWHATHAGLAGQVLLESDKAVDLDWEVQ